MINTTETTVRFSVVEAMTWQLAAEIVRRHPELWAIRTEIQFGFYNMVTLRPLNALDPSININKGSAVAIEWFGEDVDVPSAIPQMNMRDYASAEDPRDWILELERNAGLTSPAGPLPSSTPNSLVVRWLGAFTTAQMNARRHLTPETRPEWLTTSLTAAFPSTAAWARNVAHPAPGTLTVFLEDNGGQPAAAISASGILERPSCEPVDLVALYRTSNRSLITTLAASGTDLLPYSN